MSASACTRFMPGCPFLGDIRCFFLRIGPGGLKMLLLTEMPPKSHWRTAAMTSINSTLSINQSKFIFRVITENHNVINAIALERLSKQDLSSS